MRRLGLRSSLTVNAASLLVATVATNALGLVFWIVAAHLETPRNVGRAAAAVAALTLLATFGQLNLTNVFVRLLPTAGRLGAGLVRRGYLAVIVLTLVLGGVYVTSGLGAGVVTGGLGARVLFTLGVTVLGIFALQDSVLTALRLTPWIPVENISAGVCKLALLPVVLLAAGAGAIAAAWVIPALVAVLVVSTLLFKRAFPKLADTPGTLPPRRRLASFVAGEYVGNICAVATIQLMPLIIVWRLGPAQAAYFTLPWLIAAGITMLLWNVAGAFIVELTSTTGGSGQLLRRSLMLWAGVVAGALVVCTLGARPLLDLVGARYAAHGAPLLRLIGLSAPFGAVIAFYCTLVWLDQQVWLLAGFLAVSGAVQIATTLVLLPQLGLVAAGWANLITQAGAAALMAPLAAGRVRRGNLLAGAA
jgi:O-antigen/teichoic acid export membrane protein